MYQDALSNKQDKAKGKKQNVTKVGKDSFDKVKFEQNQKKWRSHHSDLGEQQSCIETVSFFKTRDP